MTDKNKIRNIIELFIAWNGETEPIDVANIDSAVEFIGNSLQEDPVSEELEEAAKHYLYSNILYDDVYVGNPTDKDCIEMFKAGAKWQKEHLWKPADGDDLPIFDREVIVLCKSGRVAFGHRPSEKFIARPIGYGRTEECEVETYDKGGWNIPNIVYWLDVELPK